MIGFIRFLLTAFLIRNEMKRIHTKEVDSYFMYLYIVLLFTYFISIKNGLDIISCTIVGVLFSESFRRV